MELDFEQIEAVLRVFSASAACELEIETEGLLLKFKRSQAQVLPEGVTPAADQSAFEPQDTMPQEPVYDFVRADRVGFFYLGEEPEGEPLLKVHDELKRGQQVGSIVAIGVANPLFSTLEGEVIEILLEDGQAVEFAEPLFKVKTADKS